MRILVYSSNTAVKNLMREKWINILSALSISVVMMILGAFMITSYNVDAFIKSWFSDFNIIVYLDKDISADQEEDLKNFLRKDLDTISMKFISSEEALAGMKEALGTDSSLLDAVEGNPLPSSIELKIKKSVLNTTLLNQKAAMIRQLSGVKEVQFGEKWITSLLRASKAVRALSLLVGSLLLTAIIFISYTTIKILFFRRKEEIETMKMLGATKRFIRLPFQIEGLIIGAVAGALCSVSLFAANHFILLRMTEILPALGPSLPVLQLELFLSGPAAGALLSLIGSHIAIGKIRY